MPHSQKLLRLNRVLLVDFHLVLVWLSVGFIELEHTILVDVLIQLLGTMLTFLHIYVYQGIFLLLGLGIKFIATVVNILPLWFSGGKHDKRITDLGIAVAGSGGTKFITLVYNDF
ncbi:unnamed protein product [Ambrosiozyma monospora]|uniref:Unnamed protein product n=1 Tax=Ambrosiozyma monospora TaxID=43982 RepID=A0A9W6Z3D5_AMBMO|nr:unnamed protein product [Ambrosiozyma monospora]